MLEISTTNVLLVLAVWVFAFYIAVKRLSAVQRLLAFSLHHILRRYAAVDSNGKPSCQVTSTTSGTIPTHMNPWLHYQQRTANNSARLLMEMLNHLQRRQVQTHT